MSFWTAVGAVVVGGLILGAATMYAPKAGYLLPGGKV